MAEGDQKSSAFLKYDDWIKHWSDDDTPFHVTEPDEVLIKKADEIFGDKPNKVFVPCCGKTFDMMWMYNRGYTVVGAEIAEKAVLDFFKEQKLKAKVVDVENVGKLYRTGDGRIQLYACDIFNLKADQIGTFDVIWDSAGFSVINKEDRPRYFSLIKSIMKSDTAYFLIGADYDRSVWPGPPHPLNVTELTEMCGDTFEIEQIHEMDMRSGSDCGHGGDAEGHGSTPEDGGKDESKDSFSKIAEAISKSPYMYFRYHRLTLKK